VDPVPDPLLLRKSGSAGNRTRTSGLAARNSDHYTTEVVYFTTHLLRILETRVSNLGLGSGLCDILFINCLSLSPSVLFQYVRFIYEFFPSTLFLIHYSPFLLSLESMESYLVQSVVR
jgi:hypothetical protein